MAHVIELLGAPGTGKSSLARALDGRRVGRRRIVVAQRLLRVARRPPLGPLLRRSLTPAERRRALAGRREDWAELLDIVAAAPLGREDGSGDPLRPLNAASWLAATLELRALAADAPDDLLVVLDEGLAQRAPLVLGPDAGDRALEGYLRALPATALHVHLQVDPALLVRRLRARARTIDRHVGLDDARLEASVDADARVLARCADLLARLGARVLPVTSVAGVDEAVGVVVDALRDVG